MTTKNIPIDLADKAEYSQAELPEPLVLLGHIRKTPIILYGIFTEVCRQFYFDQNNLPLEVKQTWSKDPKLTKIWIDTEYRWEDENPEFRPAIYVKLGDITYKSITGRHDSQINMNLLEGESEFSRGGSGQVSWIHVARTKGEAVVLAGATLDYLDAFSKMIKNDFCFQSFEIVSLSPLSLDKESKERYRSVVTAAFSFQDYWSIKLESPKLKRVVIQAGQEVLDQLSL